MREILFRGKPKDQENFYFFSQCWKENCKDGFVYGSLVVDKDRCFIVVTALCSNRSNINNGITSMIEVIPETVEQYTGITDKNGNRIFEGDIVSFNRDNALGWKTSRVGDVRYYDKLPIFYIMATTGDGWDWVDCENIEVIGNIHDDPELLEEANDNPELLEEANGNA